MKPIFKYGSLVILGFVLMGTLQFLTRCNKEDDWLNDTINPAELSQNVDLAGIKRTASEIETALLSSDLATLREMTHQESAAGYHNKEVPYSTEELAEIGTAFKNRELTVSTDNFAEYTYTIDGKKYTLWMSREEQGEWKIIRY
jgi:hypothetical protein